jgi:tRNA modification GTPase
MYTIDDTIAAIATPVGEGGIGIVRISGPESLDILRLLFRDGNRRRLAHQPDSHRLHYGHLIDPETRGTVDEVLASYMQAPHTYTRQDVVEINCHGGIMPLRRTLNLVLRHGARLARPGEFTLRAFVNGRLDLAQAEAVLDVIRAKTDAGLRVAVQQLEGRLSEKVRHTREKLVDILAYLEASIDFAEDVPEQDITLDLAEAQEELAQLCAEADQGMIYRQGIRTAIVGRPNVGKSSLLNALLRENRAIVTPVPGTTRDTLEETVNLQGIPLCLVDTAGIAPTQNVVEQLGIERSRKALEAADLVLMVIDRSAPLTPLDWEIAEQIADKTAILVINKIDLSASAEINGLLPDAPRIHVSALTGQGLEALEAQIERTVLAGETSTSDTPLVSNPRHQALLQRALDDVQDAQRAYENGLPDDLLAIDISAAVDELGELTGESASADLLETIFSRFCIGK